MGKWACQHHISTTPSWECELTCETIPISVANLIPQIPSEVLNIFLCMYIWENIWEKMLSTFLNSSWESGRVNLILLPDLVGDVN